MKVIIPVAGIGSRLRPHTHSAPKALLYVAGKPILGHILDQVIKLDPSEVVFVIGFLGEKIIEYVKSKYKINARFVEQKQLLGLGYAIYLGLAPDETEDILVILGDTIIETNWQALLERNQNILGVKEVDDPRRFGVVEIKGSRITDIIEKPTAPKSNLAAVGLYYIKDSSALYNALNKVYKQELRTKGEFQVTDAFQLLIRDGFELYAHVIDGWYDCGERETMLETNKHLLAILPEEKKQVQIPGSVIVPPVYIAPDAIVENSIIGPNTSVAARSVIKNSIVSNSILSAGARVENARLASSLVGNNSVVKGAVKILNVGDSSEISY